uniref:Legumain prodomain domain-containing protein n=1 Tax=Brassica oleracea var. oleracea TaxID=109376 RepID=A0A0D2ZZ29_BRAOL
MYQTSEDGSRKDEILKELTETTRHRKHVDTSVELIGTVLFGPLTNVLNSVREPGLPLVDDWECLKSMVRVSHSFLVHTFIVPLYLILEIS